MKAPSEATLLRIFIGHDDTYVDENQQEQPLYEAIAFKARQQKMAGLTVSRGIVGFGPGTRRDKVILRRSDDILRRSEDLPVIIEMVDTESKITSFLPMLEGMIRSGLVTVERVKAYRYGPFGPVAE